MCMKIICIGFENGNKIELLFFYAAHGFFMQGEMVGKELIICWEVVDILLDRS